MVDPRTKLIVVICLSSMAVLMNNLFVLLALSAISFILLLLLKVNLTGVFARIRLLFAAVVFVGIMQIVFAKENGLVMAGEFLLRMLVIVASAAVLTTCSSREIIQGMVKMGLPYEIAFMAVLGIRFLPAFKEEFQDAVVAIRLRGIDFMSLRLRQKIDLISKAFMPVAAGAIIQSRALSMSIEMRGFRSKAKRTEYKVLKLKAADCIIMGFSVFITVFALIGYYRYLA